MKYLSIVFGRRIDGSRPPRRREDASISARRRGGPFASARALLPASAAGEAAFNVRQRKIIRGQTWPISRAINAHCRRATDVCAPRERRGVFGGSILRARGHGGGVRGRFNFAAPPPRSIGIDVLGAAIVRQQLASNMTYREIKREKK